MLEVRRSCLAVMLLPLVVVAVRAAEKRPLTVEDLWKVKRVGPPSMAPDGKWAAVEVTAFDMDKDESTSDIWLLSTDGKTQKQLTNYPGKSSAPKWSPDGKQIAFTSKRGNDEHPQIYVISPEGGEARRASDMPFAAAHVKWGADSKTLYCIAWTWPDTPDDEAYKKKDKELRENKVKAYVIDDAVYRYWDKWIADGKRPMVFSVDVASGKHKNLLAGTGRNLPPYEPSANDYDVSPDGKELCFVAENVKEIGLDANHDLFTLALEQEGAKVKCITEDNQAHDTSPAYSPDGKHIAFLRQTIKFFYADRARLMVHHRGSQINRSIPANIDRSCGSPKWMAEATALLSVVEEEGQTRIYSFITEDNERSEADPRLRARALTWGYSDSAFDFHHGGKQLVFVRSSFDSPSAVLGCDLSQYVPGGTALKTQAIEHFNDQLVAQWKLGKTESIMIKGADDRDVQMFITYPPDFDPAKRWPLVQMVHGGPHNGVVSDFHFRWNAQLWAAQGWVVAQVNFHGSSGFGQAFTDSITGDYGAKPLADVLKATDWFEQQPWIDKDRMAAAGASYGGYMMAYMNGHTDRFKAMVCHAGVYNYATQMASDLVRSRKRALGGFPWEDYARSDKQSANRFAHNFKTPTLVIHGEKDFRVPVTHGFEYFNTLKMKGVPARLIYFPDENHWILKPQNSRLWHKEVFAWIEKYIGRGPSS